MRTLSLSGITFTYRGAEAPALRGVEFHAEEGERVAVVGLTAAGKSTLLRCANRLVPASFKGEFAGRAELLGEDLAGKRPAELAGVVGMVFQDFESQLFSTTAELDVAFGPENLGLATPEIQARVARALDAVGMSDWRGRDPASLSGGQKQRVAIASVLALTPRLLALDEPTTDLDPVGRAEITELLRALCQQGLTVILAEHEIELITYADRIVGLAAGEKVFDDAAARAFADPPLLAALGVRPPDVAAALAGLGLPARMMAPSEAAALLAREGLRPGPDSAARLASADIAARAAEGAELIRLDGLTHRYPGGVEAVTGASAVIRRGEMVAFLGHNGSGKTTLIKHVNGLLKPTAGAVLIEGRDTRGMTLAELGRRVGFVFQDPDHQIFAGRVFDEAAFAPRNFGFKEPEVKDRVTRALAAVGLTGAEERDPFMMTKGERQRLALASVLAAEPEVLILDEPTTGLDYPAQRAVMDLLAELNRAGRTVIVVTHALWVAAEYARRCLVMSNGRIVADGPTRAVLGDGATLAVAGLREPAIVALGRELGAPTLSVAELVAALKGGR